MLESQFRMSKTERELREDIVHVGRLVFEKGWVAANDGNISIRLDEDRILCTPTATSKGMLHVDDLIIVDMQGNKIQGRKERTSEIMMHLTVYGVLAACAAGVRSSARAIPLAQRNDAATSMKSLANRRFGRCASPRLVVPDLIMSHSS